MEKIKEITLPDGWVVDKVENGKVILKEDDTKPIIKWNKEKDGVEVIADGYHFIIASMPTILVSYWAGAKILCEKWGGYLPSVGELKVMAKYIEEINQCFKDNDSPLCLLDTDECYWSSSEVNDCYARHVDTYDGFATIFNKINNNYVRVFLNV